MLPPDTSRILLSPSSETSRSPDDSIVTVRGIKIKASTAGPPSPHGKAGWAHGIPVPTAVDMFPDVSTLRIRLFSASTKYRLPCESNAGARGSYKLALVAGPPSPTKPLPTTVVMILVLAVYRRMRLLQKSAIQRLPVMGSTNSPAGFVNSADRAGPPSPLNPKVVFPTIVLIWFGLFGFVGENTSRITAFSVSEM